MFGCFSLPAWAADGDVRIAGQTVFTALAGDDTNSVSQRADAIQNNLDNALVAAKDHSPQSVGIAYVRGLPVITLGGYQVVTVNAQDGTAAHITPALVAQKWADSMRSALSNNASINSYVAQLTGPPQSVAPAPAYQVNVSPPANQTNGTGSNRPYDTYNSSASGSAPNNYGGSPQGQSSYAPNNYGGSPQWQGSYSPTNNGSSPQGQGAYQQGQGNYPQGQGTQGYRQGRLAYAQAGQIIPVTLATSISTQIARVGDLIQANITQAVNLGDSTIPAGSVVIGQVTDSSAGGRMTHSGELQIKFNRIRTPDGTETPISAHLVGGIGKFKEVGGDQSDTFKGETMGNKVGSVAFRGLLGAGGGAALGTAVGAIAGGGHGAGMGAWSGAAIGGGLGAADSLLLRKGRDVTVPSGTQMKLQLDAPVSVSGVVPSGY